jgi:hypothetical protein
LRPCFLDQIISAQPAFGLSAAKPNVALKKLSASASLIITTRRPHPPTPFHSTNRYNHEPIQQRLRRQKANVYFGGKPA